jgi:FkbM family methyltransferase
MIKKIHQRLVHKIVNNFIVPKAQLSYSQFGEDLILGQLFYRLGIKYPTYLDIGANEPKFISNTYYFYQRGSKGVLVEPNPYLFKKLQKARSKDIVVNCGIGFSEKADADFFMFPNYANGLSTFSKTEAEHWQNVGMKGLGKIPIEKTIKMPLVPINKIFEQNFKNETPNFISLDVEGLDLEILKSINFSKYKPDVICVETLKYNEHQETYKDNEIIEFMLSKDYVIYADTRVNTIFCKKEIANK